LSGISPAAEVNRRGIRWPVSFWLGNSVARAFFWRYYSATEKSEKSSLMPVENYVDFFRHTSRKNPGFAFAKGWSILSVEISLYF
jgi:hypothetical protein